VVPRAVTMVNAQTKKTKTQDVKVGLIKVIVLMLRMRHIWPSIAASHAFVNSFRQHPVMLMLVSNITTRKERSAQVWKKKKKKVEFLQLIYFCEHVILRKYSVFCLWEQLVILHQVLRKCSLFYTSSFRGAVVEANVPRSFICIRQC